MQTTVLAGSKVDILFYLGYCLQLGVTMNDERYHQGLALDARRLHILPEAVEDYFADRVGARFGREVILSAAGAWADDQLSLRDLSLVVITALMRSSCAATPASPSHTAAPARNSNRWVRC